VCVSSHAQLQHILYWSCMNFLSRPLVYFIEVTISMVPSPNSLPLLLWLWVVYICHHKRALDDQSMTQMDDGEMVHCFTIWIFLWPCLSILTI
jgi:hypothetical protein